ncbi:MAG: glycosyltransferase 87 family protein, partial [Candidatus Dormibacteria bacterium]
VLSGLIYGQFDALLFAALAGSMLLAWHDRPLGAGLVMGVTLLKPDLLWPAPIFMFLAIWPHRDQAARFAIGFLAVCLAWLALSWSQLGNWLQALSRFGHMVSSTPSRGPAGLPGLVAAAPSPWAWRSGLTQPPSLALMAAALLGMAVLGLWMARSPDWRGLSQVGRITWAVGLAMALWLVATPYNHANDDLLLLPLFMLTVGRDARRLHGLGLGPALALAALLLLVWPGGVVPWQLGLAIFALAAGAAWWWRTDARLTGLGAGLCLLGLALLPPVWSLHVLRASLTPVAVLLLVVEGARTCWMEVGGAGTGPVYFAEPALPGVAGPASRA